MVEVCEIYNKKSSDQIEDKNERSLLVRHSRDYHSHGQHGGKWERLMLCRELTMVMQNFENNDILISIK